MDDLFRFLLLRPANRVDTGDVKTLGASFIPAGTGRPSARRLAQAFVDRGANVTSTSGLKYAAVASELAAKLRAQALPLADVVALVKNTTKQAPAAVIADPKFAAEESLVADSLVAMKLLSSSAGADGPDLAAIAQGYDALRLAASGRDPVGLRVLSIAAYPTAPSTGTAPPPPAPPAPPPADPSAAALADIDAAIKALTSQSASGFQPGVALARAVAATAPAPPPVGVPSSPLPAPVSRPWVMTAAAVAALPPKTRAVLAAAGLDPATQALPRLIEQLQEQRTQLQFSAALAASVRPGRLIKVGNSFDPIVTSDYVGAPAAGPPTGHGNIRPIGIGDLLMVKEHVLRYEGGELAHVENVLKSEHMSRKTRRLERTETTILQETESTKEETRDTQTTDRFSLKRETSDTIKTDASIKAGLSVDSSYGPTVEVKATTDFSTSGSAESSVKTASEFSKDVVDRSVSKLVERVLERRSVTTLAEFEEKYSHGFDNTGGTGHISGFYQWIDKVLQAQVYNYGKRLLFDVTVPEPGTNFMLALTRVRDVGQALEKPEPFTATALDINEGNYAVWAKKYDATGLEPPPPPIKTIVQAIDGVFSQDGHESSKSGVLAIDDGYRAKYASFVKDAVVTDPHPQWRLFVGSAWYDAMTGQQYVDLAGEINSIGFAYDAHGINVLSASIEIFCERTARAVTTWQLKTHAAITQAFQAKMQIYDQALAQARAEAETVIAGRNPAFNQRLMSSELRRQCLTLVTGQQFDSFGALELAAEGYAQPNLDRTAAQMPYVRFFEQAFEWEHLVYFFYPYFWGWKAGWKNRMLLDDIDAVFADFLRSGAARVVFPVRPGFEAAVVHYLETGELWNGGPPPDISDPLYVSIISEIQEATGAPGNETPVGDPWEVRLPTTLVRLRPNDDLPEWQKVGEEWRPKN